MPMGRKKKNNTATYTKIAVKWILAISLIDLQISYILAFLGRVEIAEDLSSTVATAVIGVMLGYFMKSFFETREEKKLEFEKEKEWKNEPPEGGSAG